MNTAEACDITDVGGLNDQGLIVGTCHVDIPSGIRAFSHDGDEFIVLPVLDEFSFTFGNAANNDLTIAGSIQMLRQPQPSLAAIWNASELVVIDGLSGPNAQAVDINNSGQILAWTGQWYFYDADTVVIDGDDIVVIGKPPGA